MTGKEKEGVFRSLILTALLLAGALIAGGVAPVAAQTQDIFIVHDIPLAKRASTAQAARTAALAEGQRQALDIMLRRLTLSRDWIALPDLDDSAVNGLVAAIQIDDEKISAGSYEAKLTVEFEADGIRGLLRKAGIAFSEARYRPVLVIPIYGADGLLSFSYGTNPLKTIWEDYAAHPGLIPFRVPGYDGTASVSLAPDEAFSLSDALVDQFRQSTGTVAVVVVRVDVLTSGGRPRVHLMAKDYGDPEGGELDTYLYADTDETQDQLVARAAAKVRTGLEDHWKGQTLARFDERNELHVEVPLTTLPAWRDLQKLLKDNILIDHIDILSLASDKAELDIHYLGPVSQLRLSLAQDNLDLQPVQDANAVVPEAPQNWRLLVGAPHG